MNQSRVPEGVPTGGQFAASARSESDINLTDDASLADLSDRVDELREKWDCSISPQQTADDIAALVEQAQRNPELSDADRQTLLEAVDNMVNHPDDHEPFDSALAETERVLHNQMIADALGDGPELTAEEKQLLETLLDRELHENIGNDTNFETILETVADWGDSDDWYGVTQIGEMLWSHHEREKGSNYRAPGSMDFTIHHQPDSYDIPMYSVGYHLGSGVDSYLTMTSDGKYLSSRDSSGLRAAIETASVIEGDYQQQRSKAIRLGLVTDPEAASGEPDLATARNALADYDRSNDPDVDTMAAMRDSLAAYVAKDATARATWA